VTDEKKPLRAVRHSLLRVGCSFMMVTRPRYYFWELHLVCGHRVERRCRYPKQTGHVARGYAAIHRGRPRSEVGEPPKAVRCEDCAAGRPPVGATS
jgi:hypothetical protein